MQHPDLVALNHADDKTAAAMILPFIERAPNLAAKIATQRPFASAQALADHIVSEVNALSEDAAISLFLGHPELAPIDPAAMTNASQQEQGRLGLTTANAATSVLAEMNARYFDRFGFPFIIALHEHVDLASVLTAFDERSQARKADEITRAKAQICSVSRARVLSNFAATPVAS